MAEIKKNVVVKSKSLSEDAVVTPAKQLQHLYADSPVELGIGPFVSRVVFGTQVSGAEVNTQFQLVMPSNALLNLAELIVSTFAKESETGRLQGAQEQFITKITSGGIDKPKA